MKVSDLLEAPIGTQAAQPAPGVAPQTGPAITQPQTGISPQQQLAAQRRAEADRKKQITAQIADLEKQIVALRAQLRTPT